jgi:hypothetical protein
MEVEVLGKTTLSASVKAFIATNKQCFKTQCLLLTSINNMGLMHWERTDVLTAIKDDPLTPSGRP